MCHVPDVLQQHDETHDCFNLSDQLIRFMVRNYLHSKNIFLSGIMLRMSGLGGDTMFLIIFMISGGSALSNLPNHTELMVSVLADEAWVKMEGFTLNKVEEMMTASITGSSSEHVSMKMTFTEMTPGNITDNIDTGK